MRDAVLFDLPTSIDTERLFVRAPQAGDGLVLHAAITESLEELRRFPGSLPWAVSEQTVESAELYCRNGHSNFIARRDLPFLLFERDTGELVGSASLHGLNWDVPKTGIGYWVRTPRAGKGYISEAVDALTTYAFAHLEAARVEIFVDELNTASRRVAERCGYELEGILRHDRRAPDGLLRSTCIYARCWIRHAGGFERVTPGSGKLASLFA